MLGSPGFTLGLSGFALGLSGFALGLSGFALGLSGFVLSLPGFFYTNMLVSIMRKSHIGGIVQCEAPMGGSLRCSGI